MTIVLETPRLIFRPHAPEDLEAYCAMEADPEVRRYVGGNPRPREQAEARFRDQFLLPISTNRLALWATLYRPEGRYIGYCGVYPHFDSEGVPIPGEGSLAYYLARPYWGMGLATEAGEAFLKFGFAELGLNRIVTLVDAGNQASLRVLEKLGMHRTRSEPGPKRSFYFFELTRTQFLETLSDAMP